MSNYPTKRAVMTFTDTGETVGVVVPVGHYMLLTGRSKSLASDGRVTAWVELNSSEQPIRAPKQEAETEPLKPACENYETEAYFKAAMIEYRMKMSARRTANMSDDQIIAGASEDLKASWKKYRELNI